MIYIIYNYKNNYSLNPKEKNNIVLKKVDIYNNSPLKNKNIF